MNRTLLSLAILKINWETAKVDYIDNFIPFLGYLLVNKKYERIEGEGLGNLKADFKEEYGLVIPNYALLTICNRAARHNYNILKRESGFFYVNTAEAVKYGDVRRKEEIESQFSFVIHRIITFAKTEYGVDLTEEELSEAIIVFLKHHDLDILFAARDHTVLPKARSSAKKKYIISSFAIYAKENEMESFQALSDLAIGNALACAILYSDTTYSGRLKNLNIYLDTPLVLTLVGLSGVFKQEAFKELLVMLKNDKANLKILDTTRGEVDHILENCRAILEKGEENVEIDKAPIAVRHCINNSISASDLEMKILGLDNLLQDNGIEKSKVPDYMETKEFQIDEDLLKQTIVDTYKTHTPDFVLTLSKERTIDRDVKVLSGIYRFREGLKPRAIRQSKGLFITSNTSLAFASRLYEQKIDKDPSVIPSCLTDVFIGTVLWLQSPQKVLDLNEKKFIADCYAASQPSEALINAYMCEIEKLKKNEKISLDDYYLLRSHRTSLSLLEEKTMGDPDAVTGDTIGDIILKIKAGIKGQAEIDLNNEKQLHNQTKTQLDDQIEKYYERENKIEERAEQIARLIANILWIFIFVLLAVVFYVTTIPGFNLASTLLAILLVTQIILTLLNIMTGFNFWGLKTKLTLLFKKKILDFLE